MTDAEAILRNLLDKIIDQTNLKDITVKALTSGGANYTSTLFSATITPNHGDTLKLFAKVANINKKLRAIMSVKTLFDTEQYVYTDLVKAFERIQDRHNLEAEHRFIFPKFYGGTSTEGEETVVLEDLVDKGYIPYSRFKPVDWEHAAAAVESLAKYHALSFAFAAEEPENFEKAKEKLTFQLPKQSDDPAIKGTWAKMMGSAVAVAREEHRERVEKFLLSDMTPEEIFQYRRPLSTPVFCHGDYRISNLLFQRQNGRLEAMVLDYQTVCTGCPATDLLYLEFMGTDEEFRKENHERLVDHYFMELTQALDRLGVDVNEVYPRETFDDELQKMLRSALLCASFILPLVLVEADCAPQMGGDISVEGMAVSPNEQFAERFSGIISDCVRWGAI